MKFLDFTLWGSSFQAIQIINFVGNYLQWNKILSHFVCCSLSDNQQLLFFYGICIRIDQLIFLFLVQDKKKNNDVIHVSKQLKS